MKFILCQPAIKRFQWELDICIHNLKKHGVNDIVLLFSRFDDSIPEYFKQKYGCEVHVYDDTRTDKSYIPSIKPYLWYRYLSEHPEASKETYFYMDSDVIFRELPDFSSIEFNSSLWVGSNCNGYLNADYIKSKGEVILNHMTEIIGLKSHDIEEINENSIGAQWIITNPTADYWLKVYNDSNKLYHYFESLDSDIQKWTAEMWAQLWNVLYFNKKVAVSKELDFCWATDESEKWFETNIYHNAGVTEEMTDLFFKGKYDKKSPFNDDLKHINKNKCSSFYVKELMEVTEC